MPLICLLQFMTCFYYDLWIVSSILCVCMLLFSSFGEMIAYIFFFQMFSTFGHFSVISIFASVIIILIRYIVGIIRKTEKFYVFPFVLTTIICVIYSSFNYGVDSSGIYQGWSLIATLYIIYLAFVYRRYIDFQKIFEFLMYGIITTACLSCVSMLIEHGFSEFFDNFARIKLYTKNANSLAIYCSLSLSYFTYAFLNGKGTITKNLIFSIIAIAFGFATKSKSFLIVCIVILLYLLIMLIKKYKINSIKIILIILSVLSIVCFIFREDLQYTFSRFTVTYSSSSLVNNITTGRYDIWLLYRDHIISSIQQLLFGVGFFSKRIAPNGPHSLFIHLIYRTGLVGLILIGILLYSYFKSLGSKFQLRMKSFLPIFIFLLIGCVESFL